MMASFPFPEEAANIARGDYANALFHMDIDLNRLIKSPGDTLPDPINVCVGALPAEVGELCKGLDEAAKKLVCQLNPRLSEVLCPDGTIGVPRDEDLPDLPGLGGTRGGNGGGGGGLGSLLGGGGGG
jgi:phospholipid/cholesterol/gamma-HCH transport system substrate-binding protein